MSNIVEVVVADKNLSTMSKGVKAAGIEEDLAKEGPFTVFAPSEIAFGKLPGGELTDLLKPENQERLAGVMNFHIAEGKTGFRQLKDGQKLKTISGKELLVRVYANGEVTINGAKVQSRDKEASNGVVHSLDTVMKVI